MKKYNKETDGVDHINVNLEGKTELGRKLALEYPRKFEKEGRNFKSLYQYWIWLNSGKKDNVLNHDGWRVNPTLIHSSLFGLKTSKSNRTEMMSTVTEVLAKDKHLVNELNKTDLKLTQYETLNDGEKEVVIGNKRPWYLTAIDDAKEQ